MFGIPLVAGSIMVIGYWFVIGYCYWLLPCRRVIIVIIVSHFCIIQSAHFAGDAHWIETSPLLAPHSRLEGASQSSTTLETIPTFRTREGNFSRVLLINKSSFPEYFYQQQTRN